MKTYAAVSLLALAAMSSQAWAQISTDNQEEIDEIVVTATGLSSATSTTKTKSPIIESSQSLSIISREEMELRAVATIADALSYTAGVQAEPSGIDSRTDEISVRGFGAGGFSSNNNFVDGLRLPTGGQWTRFGFDPYGLQQLEVLKGPSSVLYGQAAPGGIVNVVTKRPTRETQFNAHAQATGYTDLDNWSLQIGADASGSLNESQSVYGRIVGLVRDGDTAINKLSNSRYYISPSVTWEPTSQTEWTLLAQYQKDQGGATFQFLPLAGALEPTNGGFIENDTLIGEVDWNTFDRDQLLIGSFLEHSFTDQLTFRNNMRYTEVDTLYQVTVLSGGTVTDCTVFPSAIDQTNCIPGQTIGRRAVQGVGDSQGFSVDNQLEYIFNTGQAEHTLLGGVDYFKTEWDHARDLVSQPGQNGGQVEPLYDIFNPIPRGASTYPNNMSPQIYGAAESKQTGIYLQDQISLNNWRFTLGGRQDWAEDSNVNTLTGIEYGSDAEKFTWRGGAVYLFDNGFAPYFSYSESFLPSVADPSSTLGSVAFEPTTGQQYEGGIRYQGGNNIYVTLGAFNITQQNVATADPNGVLCGRRVCQVQAGEADVKGIEFEARAPFDNGTTLIASASKLSSEVSDPGPALNGKELVQVPDVLASFFVDHKFKSGGLEGFGIGAGLRYTGESFGDSSNTIEVPDYTLFDLYARYDLTQITEAMEGTTLSLSMRNVGNKRYVATCSSVASCFYGQGRVLTLRLGFNW